jgi:hypothetical protein
MARTLKSDKVLFFTTVVLVCVGVVMVYSASALLANNRYGSSHVFLTSRRCGRSWTGRLAIVMRVDYRISRAGIWTTLGWSAGSSRSVQSRSTTHGVGSGWRTRFNHRSLPSSARFCGRFLERRMHRINDLRYLGCQSRGGRGLVGLIGGAGFRDVHDDVPIAAVMVFARPERLPAGRSWGRTAVVALVAWSPIACVGCELLESPADLTDNGYQIIQSCMPSALAVSPAVA